ncbi:hypothetical protein BGZ73_009191 [Actinomortierella ambigua]|nr:hypothetical protein BGZ73_009191 [Actinomortierella ambigua]
MSTLSHVSASLLVDGSMLSHPIGLRRRPRFAAFVADSLATTVVSIGSLASRRLGGGSFGTVFLARTADYLSELKAIKVISKKCETPAATLREEVYIHSYLSRSYGGQCHPNIAQLDCAKEDDASIFMMMEYCESGTLDDFYRRSPQMVTSDAVVARILLPVACAIAHMHRHGIGHRDLKMQNILVGGQGTIKLADFGLATREQVSNEFCGTRTTMAPEMFALLNGDVCSYQPRPVDIWALGILFWHLKFKSLPWNTADDHNSSAFRSYVSNPREFLAGEVDMTASTAELALRLLCPDPDLRADADEAVQILQAIAQ